MGKVYGLKGLSLFKEVILPGSLPSILVGIRQSLGIMWLTLIIENGRRFRYWIYGYERKRTYVNGYNCFKYYRIRISSVSFQILLLKY